MSVVRIYYLGGTDFVITYCDEIVVTLVTSGYMAPMGSIDHCPHLCVGIQYGHIMF